MSIDIGGMCVKLEERKMAYQQAGNPQTYVVREATFEVVGLPTGVVPPAFVVPMTDATKWNEMKVGTVYTVKIEGGSIP